MAAKAKRKRAALYLRCSDSSQDTSVADQRKALTRYCKDHAITIVAEYVDDGISGDETEKRTDFLRMRDEITSGKFSCVVCWDQDRFGRFDSLEAGHWIYPFRKAGVTLITTNEGEIDWEDFTQRLMYGIKQEGKHQYLRDLSRNVTRGLMESAKNGSWIGTPPYGYNLVGERKNKRLELGDPDRVSVVQRIFDEYVNQERSLEDIARRLNADGIPSAKGGIWRGEAVKVILSNEAYIGTFCANKASYSKYHHYTNGEVTKGGKRGPNDRADWIVFENHHPAIIDKPTFRKAQKILARGKKSRAKHTPENNPYLLSNKLRCGRCGGPMHGEDPRRRSYECYNAKRHGSCKGSRVREDDVLDLVREYVREEFEEVADFLLDKMDSGERLTAEELPKSFSKLKRIVWKDVKPKTDPKRLQRQIDKLTKDIEKARGNLALLDPEFIPDTQAKIHNWEDQQTELRGQLERLPTETDIEAIAIGVLQSLEGLWHLNGNIAQEVLPPFLRNVDYITVNTQVKGVGTALRHRLTGGQVHFSVVGLNPSNLNPDLTG